MWRGRTSFAVLLVLKTARKASLIQFDNSPKPDTAIEKVRQCLQYYRRGKRRERLSPESTNKLRKRRHESIIFTSVVGTRSLGAPTNTILSSHASSRAISSSPLPSSTHQQAASHARSSFFTIAAVTTLARQLGREGLSVAGAPSDKNFLAALSKSNSALHHANERILLPALRTASLMESDYIRSSLLLGAPATVSTFGAPPVVVDPYLLALFSATGNNQSSASQPQQRQSTPQSSSCGTPQWCC
jgi:hypothetical protein